MKTKFLLFLIITVLCTQVPGLINKYHTFLAGGYFELKNHYNKFIAAADEEGITLEQFFIKLSEEGPYGLKVTGIEASMVQRYTFLDSQYRVLNEDKPFQSLMLIIKNGDVKIIEESIKMYKFEVPLGMGEKWWSFTIILAIILTIGLYIIKFIILNLLKLIFRVPKIQKAV